jgi:catechol 2,3-dioxygenase-like lactoylglutathione lyase family enzyme
MNITFHSPILITDKLEELKKFYIEQLGLEIDMDFGPCVSLKCGLSLWQLSPEHKIAKKLGRQYYKDGNKNFELSFETDDFENVVMELRKYNPVLLHDVELETWGQKTIRFFDPENNLIEIGETLPGFVKRMYKEEKSVDEIVEITSIDKNMVLEIIGVEQ